MARTVLYVRANWYGTFMLPAALMMLTYVCVWRLPALLRRPSAVRWAGRLGVVTLLAWTAGAGVVTTWRAARGLVYPGAPGRGTMRMGPNRGRSFAEAVRL